MFDSVAERYDLMNDLMSLGLHRAWKAFAVAVARVRGPASACSTSPAAAATSRARLPQARPGGEVWITDINAPMLARGRDRLLDAGLPGARGAAATPSGCRFARAQLRLRHASASACAT